jgi:hypothetical protein
MTKIDPTVTPASGGVKDHNALYVLAGSVAFIIIAFVIVFALR